MARTYYAEGRQLAYFLRGIAVMVSLGLFHFIPGLHWGFFFGFLFVGIILAEVMGARWTKKRRKAKKVRGGASPSKRNSQVATSRKSSKECRSDDVILSSTFDNMSGPEFERLLALYFRDQGYTVKEVGVGGNDGGVDLVIINKRGEKIAVQAKCYADRNTVSVQTVRELVAAKRNHDCILSLLITTSDLTAPAKKEAEQFKVDYWHGALVEHKLKAWGKWQPSKKRKSTASKVENIAKSEVSAAKREVAVASFTKCVCGAPMVKRKNKQGGEFLGCSKFPSCRHTKAL